MKELKENILGFWKKEWSLSDKVLITITTALTGIILGFLCSPVKGGIFSGNKIGSQNTLKCEDEREDSCCK